LLLQSVNGRPAIERIDDFPNFSKNRDIPLPCLFADYFPVKRRYPIDMLYRRYPQVKQTYINPFKGSVMQVQEYGTAKADSTWQRAGVEPADVVGSSGREITWRTAKFAWDSGLVL
jgi:hypothetical protein